MDERKNREKKLVGSVAVDSETGMEHYSVPKTTNQLKNSQTEPSSASSQSTALTPNYHEKTEGESQNLAGVPEEFMNLFEHDANEVILLQALRHPIGVVAIFSAAGAAGLLIIIAFTFLASDSAFFGAAGFIDTGIGAIGALITLFLLVLIAGMAFLMAYVYKKSRLILTNQKVVLIQYHSLISREVSRLNIGEVEDVNVSQPTLWDRIFKTGTITVETAGEQNNYVLTQVDKPYEFARKTIQMHEGSIAEYGN